MKMLKVVKGTYDIMPEDAPSRVAIEEISRKLFKAYGFGEIRTPFFEYTDLFVRSIGDTTDIVEKEMYTFADSKNRNISLRPEGTASVVRAYLEHKVYAQSKPAKYFYMGPMFRHERPQSGRYRQFNQIGAEFFGESSHFADAEVISMIDGFFKALGLLQAVIKINTVGCNDCRPIYRDTLKESMGKHLNDMCPNCQNRFERNPLRVFDCKEEKCKEVVKSLPLIKDNLCHTCDTHFSALLKVLDSNAINYQIDEYMVRGLDYYTQTVFEVTHSALGAQNAVAAGGRYNNLVESMGGPSVPAVGFAAGVERIMLCLLGEEVTLTQKEDKTVYLISLGEEAKDFNFKLLNNLRKHSINACTGYETKSLKAQMRQANKAGADFVCIVGEDEINAEIVCVKNMETGAEESIPAADICGRFLEILQK